MEFYALPLTREYSDFFVKHLTRTLWIHSWVWHIYWTMMLNGCRRCGSDGSGLGCGTFSMNRTSHIVCTINRITLPNTSFSNILNVYFCTPLLFSYASISHLHNLFATIFSYILIKCLSKLCAKWFTMEDKQKFSDNI